MTFQSNRHRRHHRMTQFSAKIRKIITTVTKMIDQHRADRLPARKMPKTATKTATKMIFQDHNQDRTVPFKAAIVTSSRKAENTADSSRKHLSKTLIQSSSTARSPEMNNSQPQLNRRRRKRRRRQRNRRQNAQLPRPRQRRPQQRPQKRPRKESRRGCTNT